MSEQDVIWQAQAGPQTALLSAPDNRAEIFFGGARGGGKTDGCIGSWMAHENRHGKHAKGIIFRRSMSELEEVQNRMMEIFPAMGATYAVSTKTWIWPSGGTLKLRFLDADEDATKYQGHAYTWMAFDEAGNWPSPKPIDMLRATLRSVHGVPTRLLLTGNPGGKGHDWIKERYIDPARPMTPFLGPDGHLRVFIPSRLQDNLLLMEKDPGYINRLKASGPSWLVKAWLEGDWAASEKGNLFKREHWKFYDPDQLPKTEMIIQSLDSAFKTGSQNDYSVCSTWARCKDGYYLLHVWRGKVEFPELKRQAVALAAIWKPSVFLVEDKASGQSLIQELRRDTRLPVIPVQVEGDKYTRACTVTPMVEAGKVYLPKDAPWLAAFMEELASFPKGSHDDQVDSFTQALNYLSGAGMESQGLFEFYRRKAEAARPEHYGLTPTP